MSVSTLKLKEKLSDLALFGGTPAFTESLHVGRPNIGSRERFFERLNDIFDRKWLTNNGPYVQELERKVAEFIGVKHCVATCNGTIALEIAIRALDMKGEVIMPAMTAAATVHALQWQAITPVFCDIDPETFCIDHKQIDKMITPKTTGMIGVHLFSRPCDTEALAEIAHRRGLKLLYDAAHAFGCTYKGKMIGSFGNAEVLSFHATKFLNTIEGGAVVTNDDELAHKIRLMRNFGFAGFDNVVYVGTNGKMNEVEAAMGLTNLEDLQTIIDANHRNYNCYLEELRGLCGLDLIRFDEKEKTNYQYIVLTVDETQTGVGRDQLIEVLMAENVIARRYFYPGCHKMEPYRSYYPHAGLLLSVTETVCSQVLVLPTGTAVGESEIELICKIITTCVNNAKELKVRMNQLVL
ncbi:MAG: DegT/DnrJ/EryC1/StrS family aminotransferase [Candidatus Omnitrophica bacterium]|nr:DegT/DnrJ/EryC1/StrS family aminotransferase [Candidatus Omnitrophota bacterium]